jgi:hypothetical protein
MASVCFCRSPELAERMARKPARKPTCAGCGGKLKIVASIKQPEVIA